MRQPTQPTISIPEDREDGIIARSGDIVSWNNKLVLWRFGFLPESDSAKAYGVSTPSFTWVIADYDGNIEETFVGFAYELPPRFQ
jgi:hypothetical protein